MGRANRRLKHSDHLRLRLDLDLGLGLGLGALLLAAVSSIASYPATRAQEAPTIATHDIHPSGDGAPRYLSALGDAVIFSADDGEHGRELWIADGSADGTRMIKDIRPGPEGSDPLPGAELGYNPVPLDARRRFTQVGDRLYFVADDGASGREIWYTDGSSEGTGLLFDVTEGDTEWSIAAWLTAHDGQLFFLGDNGEDGEELWVSDGSMEGTRQLLDLYEGPAGSLPKHLASTAVGLAFAAETEEAGIEPWISDGTAEGTRALGDLVADFDGSDPNSFFGFDGRLFFAASDAPLGANHEPWVSDGTPEGTRMLRDLNPGGRGFGIGYVEHAGLLYFSADDGVNGIEVWRSDGTPEGTAMVGEVAFRGRGSTPEGFTSFGDLLFFRAFHFSYGIEPWVSDGSIDGTRLLADINPGEVASSRPDEATVLGDRLYFSAEREGSGRELWSSDGSSAGTAMAVELRAGGQGSDPTGLVANAGRLFFSASDAERGDELRILGGEAPPPTEPAPAPSETPSPVTPTSTPPDDGSGKAIFLPYAAAEAAIR